MDVPEQPKRWILLTLVAESYLHARAWGSTGLGFGTTELTSVRTISTRQA